MLFRLRGRFRVFVPFLSRYPSRAGCGVDRMLFRRGAGSCLPGACFDGGDRNECARRTYRCIRTKRIARRSRSVP